jgi:hypothetical protein
MRGSEIRGRIQTTLLNTMLTLTVMFTIAAVVISENVNGVGGTRRGEKNMSEVRWYGLVRSDRLSGI